MNLICFYETIAISIESNLQHYGNLKNYLRAREITQYLSSSSDLVEDLSLIPSTHTGLQITDCFSAPWVSEASVLCGYYTHVPIPTHRQTGAHYSK